MPGRSNFYKVCNTDDTNSTVLSMDDIEAYHTITTQCLYIPKRAQPGLKISIAFHCTLVKNLMRITIRHSQGPYNT